MELNPKFEYRKPKQIQMTENQNLKQRCCSSSESRFGYSDLEFSTCFHRKVSAVRHPLLGVLWTAESFGFRALDFCHSIVKKIICAVVLI